MTIKIIADENIPHADEIFSQFGQVLLKNGRKLKSTDLEDAQALVVRSVTKVNQSLLEQSKIQFVGTCTIGTDHVDENYLQNAGITFKSAPGCNAKAVGEYVITNLLLYAINHQTTLKGKTIGIIGVGNVGSIVKKYATCLGMNTVLCDPPLQAKDPKSTQWSNLESALRCDYITIHVPLNMEGQFKSYHMINKETIKYISPNAVLINSCRGEVIETASLLNAIKTKQLGTTIIDVWENEPNISNELLQTVTMASPHVAGYTYDAKIRGAVMIAQDLQKHFQFKAGNFQEIGKENTPPIPINMGANDSEEQILLKCCLAFFDPRVDNMALKKPIQEGLLGAIFDDLRKNYRKRREFQTIPLNLIGSLPELNTISVLTTLGFQIAEY